MMGACEGSMKPSVCRLKVVQTRLDPIEADWFRPTTRRSSMKNGESNGESMRYNMLGDLEFPIQFSELHACFPIQMSIQFPITCPQHH